VALERALTNVLRNAVTFTPAGGRVAISARRGAGRISGGGERHGRGIPTEELGTVFQLAGRGLSRRENQGTGLGLFIARALVTAHGGSIAIDSAPGSGTTVVINLPTGATIDEHRAGA
jgi:cell cycle sensor histidine kinase DivJ